MKKLAVVFLVLALITILVSPAQSISAATPKLNKQKLSLQVGGSYTLKLLNSSGAISWSSSKSKVATVTSKGKLKALSIGSCTITAKNKGKAYTCTLTIKAKSVAVLLPALLFDKNTLNDYGKQFKFNIPNLISVKTYDDEYSKVTIYDADRLSFLKKYNASFSNYLKDILNSENFTLFTDIKSDKLFKEVKLYTSNGKALDSMTILTSVYTISVISETIQGLNLIDISDRKCNVKIIDKKTGKVLYPAK